MAILVSVKAVLRCQDFRKEFDADTAYGDFFDFCFLLGQGEYLRPLQPKLAS